MQHNSISFDIAPLALRSCARRCGGSPSFGQRPRPGCTVGLQRTGAMMLSNSSNNALAAVVFGGELPETAMGSLLWSECSWMQKSLALHTCASAVSVVWELIGELLSAVFSTPSCVYILSPPTREQKSDCWTNTINYEVHLSSVTERGA